MKTLLVTIVLLLWSQVHDAGAQNAPLCNEGYPNCESCYTSSGCVNWGPIEIKSFPMAALPNFAMPCGPNPGCVLKVAIRKRVCNGRVQMKISGMKLEGCTSEGCRCKNDFMREPMAFLFYAVGPPFINNAFGLFENMPFDWTDVDIFSYTCYGIYSNSVAGLCTELFVVPCKQYACCKYSLRIKGDDDCGTIGFVAEWLDASKKYYGYQDPATPPECAVCQHGSNHPPFKPCSGDDSNLEKLQILSALGWVFQNNQDGINDDPFDFNNNDPKDSTIPPHKRNTCVYSCFDLDTYFKTWFVRNGNLFNKKDKGNKLRFDNK